MNAVDDREPQKQTFTIPEFLQRIRDTNIIIPNAMLPNSRGTLDAARFISLETLDIVIGELNKMPALHAEIATLRAQNEELFARKGPARRKKAPSNRKVVPIGRKR